MKACTFEQLEEISDVIDEGKSDTTRNAFLIVTD
jgi:hypothetical protein